MDITEIKILLIFFTLLLSYGLFWFRIFHKTKKSVTNKSVKSPLNYSLLTLFSIIGFSIYIMMVAVLSRTLKDGVLEDMIDFAVYLALILCSLLGVPILTLTFILLIVQLVYKYGIEKSEVTEKELERANIWIIIIFTFLIITFLGGSQTQDTYDNSKFGMPSKSLFSFVGFFLIFPACFYTFFIVVKKLGNNRLQCFLFLLLALSIGIFSYILSNVERQSEYIDNYHPSETAILTPIIITINIVIGVSFIIKEKIC